MVLEEAVAEVLQKTLGAYLEGVDADNLNLSVWSGDVRLRSVRLRTEALAALPVCVLRGTVGEVRVEVPWRALRSKPIIVHVERVLLLCAPRDGDEPYEEALETAAKRQARASRLAVLEEVNAKRGVFGRMGESMGRSLVEGLLRRVVVRISDVHLRLETKDPHRGLVALGLTLRSLRFEADKEVAAAEGCKPDGGGSAPVFKLGSCEGLSLYVSPAARPALPSDESRRSLAPAPADPDSAKARDGGSDGDDRADEADEAALYDGRMFARLAAPPAGEVAELDEAPGFLLAPFDLRLRARFDRLAPSAAARGDRRAKPQLQVAADAPTLLSLHLSRSQYAALIAFTERLAISEQRHFLRPCRRPTNQVAHTPRLWWQYAGRAVDATLRARPGMRLRWRALLARRTARLRYVDEYGRALRLRGGARAEAMAALLPLEDEIESVEDLVRYRAIARAALAAAPPTPSPASSAKKEKKGWFGLGGSKGAVKGGVHDEDGDGDGPRIVSLGEAELQRLQEDLDAVAGESAAADDASLPPWYAKVRVRASLRGLWITLHDDPPSTPQAEPSPKPPPPPRPPPPILLLQMQPLGFTCGMRPSAGAHGGISLRLWLGSLRAFDLATPWPSLRTIARSEPGAGAGEGEGAAGGAVEGAAAPFWVKATAALARWSKGPVEDDDGGAGAWVNVSVDTECEGGEAARLRCNVGRLVVLVSPTMLAALLRFVTLPPSEWAAAAALSAASKTAGRSAVATAALFLQQQVASVWGDRPLDARITLCAPTLFLLEPAPATRPSTPLAGAAAAAPTAEEAALSSLPGLRGDSIAEAERQMTAGQAASKRGQLEEARECFLGAVAASDRPDAVIAAASMAIRLAEKEGGGGAAAAGEWCMAALGELTLALARPELTDDDRSSVESMLASAAALAQRRLEGGWRPPLALRSVHIQLGALLVSTDAEALMSLAELGMGGEEAEAEAPAAARPGEAVASPTDERAATSSLSLCVQLAGVRAALMGQAEPAVLLRTEGGGGVLPLADRWGRLQQRVAPKTAGRDSSAAPSPDSSAPDSPASPQRSSPPLLAPIHAQFRLAALLTPAALGAPLLDGSLRVSPLELCAPEAALPPLLSIGLGLLEPLSPPPPPPTRRGHLALTERRAVEGGTDEQYNSRLGVCYVEVNQFELLYSRGSEAADARLARVDLSRHRLVQAGPAAFELVSTHELGSLLGAASGVRLRWALHLAAPSPSLAARWMSSIAAAQLWVAAPVAPPSSPTSEHEARQQLLRFTASVPRLRVSLLLATRASSGRTDALSFTAEGLEATLSARPHDMAASVSLASIAAVLSAANGTSAPVFTTGSQSGDDVAPLGSGGAAVELSARGVLPASPLWPTVSALLSLDGRLAPLALHVGPQLLAAAIGTSGRLAPRLTAALAASALLRPPPAEPLPPPPAALFAALLEAPLPSWEREADKDTGNVWLAAAADKAALAARLACKRLSLQLHEACELQTPPPSPRLSTSSPASAGGSDEGAGWVGTPLCELVLAEQDASIELRQSGYELRAAVRGLEVLGPADAVWGEEGGEEAEGDEVGDITPAVQPHSPAAEAAVAAFAEAGASSARRSSAAVPRPVVAVVAMLPSAGPSDSLSDDGSGSEGGDGTLGEDGEAADKRSLLWLAARSLSTVVDEAAERKGPRHEHEAILHLRPVRLLAPLPYVARLQKWLDVHLSQTVAVAAAAAAEEAMVAASQAVAEVAVAAATSAHLPIRFSLHLRGPLLVLPAPPPPRALALPAAAAARVARVAARRGAVVLRFGDLVLSNALVPPKPAPGDAAGPSDAPAPPKESAHEMMRVELSRTAVFASADSRHLLDALWMPRQESESGRSSVHWMLPQLGATAELQRALTAGDDSDGVARLQVSLRAAPVSLQVAHSELLFLAAYAAAAPEALGGGDVKALDSGRASAAAVEEAEQEAPAPAAAGPAPAAAAEVTLRVDTLEGVSVTLLDDAGSDACLPLAQINISTVRSVIVAKRGGRAADQANADLSLTLTARHFNPTNGAWEPLLEAFSPRLRCTVGAAAVAVAAGASSPSKGQSIEVFVSAFEPLKLNVTHALLHSLVGAQELLDSVSTALDDPAAAVNASADAADAADAVSGGSPRLLTFLPEAVRNCTPLPLAVRSIRDARVVRASIEREPSLRATASGVAGGVAGRSWLVQPESSLSLSLAAEAEAGASAGPLGEGAPLEAAREQHEATHEASTSHCRPLVAAAGRGDKKQVHELLRRYAFPDSIDARGWSAAHEAARGGWDPCLAAVLDAGANADIVSENESLERPLHLACQAGSAACVRLLLRSSADPAAARADGQTPLALLTPLQAEGSLGKELRKALCSRLAGPTASFSTAEIAQASAGGYVDIVSRCLDARADPSSSDGSLSALMLAASNRHLPVVRLLLSAGAVVQARARGGERPGATALHLAARAGPLVVVEALLSAGADPAAEDEGGAMPHELVSSWRTSEATEVRAALRAALSRAVLAEGWVTKLGTERKVWRRRYALLLNEQLRYYGDEELKDLRGAVHLADCENDPTSPSRYPGAPGPYSLELATMTRTLVLVFGSAAELNTWMARLVEMRARRGALGALAEGGGGAEAAAPLEEEEPGERLVGVALQGFREVIVDMGRLGVSSHVMRPLPPPTEASTPPPPPPPQLVEVFDFWNAELRQLTFHAGDPWAISGGGREERKGLQFVALASEAPGAVPVYDWWSERHRRLTLHPPPAWEGETRRGLQFYAFAQPAGGTVAVHAYWNSSLKQMTVHAGPPWGHEERTTPHGTILHAYPNRAAAPAGSTVARALSASEAAARMLHDAAAPSGGADGGGDGGGGGTVGIVCEVGVSRGQRVLTLRSPVEVSNVLGRPVLLGMDEGAGREAGDGTGEEASGAGDVTELADADKQPLPLPFTRGGSKAAIDKLRIRPDDAGYEWSTLRLLDDGSALAVCQPRPSAGGEGAAGGSAPTVPWLCCVHVATAVAEGGAALGTAAEAERRRAELAAFGLPHGEVLLEAISCTGRAGSAIVPAPGWLYLTRSFLCFGSSIAHVRVQAPLEKVQVHAGSSGVLVAHCVEVVLPRGQTLSLGFGSHSRREEALGQMRRARQRATIEATSGLARWRPLSISLRPPLALLSLLPAPLHVTVRRANSARADERQRWGSTAGGGEEMQLLAGEPRAIFSLHALEPLELACWIDESAPRPNGRASSYERATLRGRLAAVRRPAAGHAEWRELCLHSPAAGGSARTVRLQLGVASDEGGSTTLTFVAPRTLHNRTDYHLALYDAGGSRPVTDAPPGSGRPFSLRSGGGSARLALWSPATARSAGAAGPTPSSRQSVHVTTTRPGTLQRTALSGSAAQGLSTSFSVEAVGNEACVEVSDERGAAMELVLSISSASAAVAAAAAFAGSPAAAAAPPLNAVALSLRNRFTLRNRTRVVVEWRQAGVATAGGVIAPGCDAPISWQSPGGTRQVRVRLADSSTLWSEPFAPGSDGEHLIKLRRPGRGRSTEDRVTAAVPATYLRCSVRLVGPRAVLLLRPLGGTRRSAPRLPYRLVNRTPLLVAVREAGCRHYDLLGARESIGYAPDVPGAPCVLRVTILDASAGSAVSLDAPLSRRDMGGGGASSEERHLGVPAAERLGGGPADEPLLLGAPCERLLSDGEGHPGWLLLTSASVSFLPFDPTVPEAAAMRATRASAVQCKLGDGEAGGGAARADGTRDLVLSTSGDGLGHWHGEEVRLHGIGDGEEVMARLAVLAAAACAGEEAAALRRTLPSRQQRRPLGDGFAEGLVEVSDFWNAELRQLTFHAGDPWAISGGGREERKGLQFVAFTIAAEAEKGSTLHFTLDGVHVAVDAEELVPVYDWWSERHRRLTLHPPPAWEGESQRGLQFYAFAQPAGGTVAVHAYWNSSLLQWTTHAGPAWRDEERPVPLFHALPAPLARAALARIPPEHRQPAAARRLCAATRGALVRQRAHAARVERDGRDARRAVLGGSASLPLVGAGRRPQNSPALVTAVRAGDRSEVESLLAGGASADSSDGGLPALHAACMHNRTELLPLLLAAGADVERRSADAGRGTPLHAALHSPLASGAAAIVLLLRHGADPTATRADGLTAAALASRSTPDGRRSLRLLTEAAALWGSEKAPRPSLVHAAASGRVRRLRALLSSRADPDARDSHGRRALAAAAARGDEAFVAELLGAGASVDAACENERGSRPLHCAAAAGSASCVDALLRAGADPQRADGRGWLPAEVAPPSGAIARSLLIAAMAAAHEGATEARTTWRRSAAAPFRAAAAGSPSAGSPATVSTRLSSEGPTGVLAILGGGGGGTAQLPQQEDAPAAAGSLAGGETPGGGGVRYSLQLSLAGVGVALVDEEPQELVYSSLSAVELSAVATDAEQSAHLSIGHAQVDCCVEASKHPVLLVPVAPPTEARADGAAPPPTLQAKVRRRMGWEGMLFLDYLSVGVQPLAIALEQNLAARLFRLAAHLPAAGAASLDGSATGAEASLAELFPADAAARDDSEPPAEIFVRELSIHPVSAAMTLQMEPLCDDPSLQRYHPTHELVGLAQQLLSLRSATLQLDSLHLDDARFASSSTLANRMNAHYQQQVVKGIYKLIGSLDLLGNPAALWSDIGGGVRTFFYEPSSGLVTKGAGGFAVGLAKGTKGLAGGVIGGAGATVFGAASGLTKLVGDAAGELAFDEAFALRRREQQQESAENTGVGLVMGLEAVMGGVVEGATGVLSKPLQGALDDGAKGFVKGLGRGLLGAAAKPLSGVASLVSKTAEGLAADAKDFASRGDKAFLKMRVRQPRLIGPDRVLLPYPRMPPLLKLKAGGDGATAGAPPVSRSASSRQQQHIAIPPKGGRATTVVTVAEEGWTER